MKQDYQIIWEKWYSPFGEDDIDSEKIAEEAIDNFLSQLGEENEHAIDEQEPTPVLSKQISTQKFMITPMGVMPITENTDSGKIFNFWIGHTNFNITKNIASVIESCEGVESLDVFTRYRFRISIGKAFVDSDVMYNINNRVYKDI